MAQRTKSKKEEEIKMASNGVQLEGSEQTVATPGKGVKSAVRPAPRPKRLNITLSPAAYKELQEFAFQTSRSMTDVVRLGIFMAQLASREATAGNSIVVMRNGSVLKEVLIPY